MKRLKLFWLPLLFLALIFYGCGGNASGGEESDTWSNISSLDQANGTWKGSFSKPQTFRQWIEDAGGIWDEEQEIFGNMNVRVDIELITTISASAKTQSGTEKATMTFSGGKINDAWPLLKASFSGSGVTTNDANHSVTYTEDFSRSITESDLDLVQINQNGTKLRIPMEETGLTASGFNRSDYLILTKQ